MPWYAYHEEDATDAAGQHVSVVLEALYTGAGAISQLAATNPSTRPAFTRIFTPDGQTLTREYRFAPGSTRQNSGQTVPAGTLTPAQDPDNAASWSLAEVIESGLI